MSKAYLEADYDKAHKALILLSKELEWSYPKAASSLIEGLDETLTIHKLKVPGLLRQALSNTNAIESAISMASNCCSRVKRWRDGRQVMRWMTAGFMQAEERFHRF